MDAQVPELNKPPSSKNSRTVNPAGYYECSICLESATDPVVTFCGHLYCWACIHKWLQVDSTSPRQCPVCKANISKNSLVPLYSRGLSSKIGSNRNPNVPSRPSIRREPVASTNEDFDVAPPMQRSQSRSQDSSHNQRLLFPYHYSHNHHVLCPYHSRSIIGGTVVANLPWVFGNHISELCYASRYYHAMDSERARIRLRQVEEFLNDLWFFLMVFVVLCFLFF